MNDLTTYILISTDGFSPKVMLVRAETETEAKYIADVKRGKVSDWRVTKADELGPVAVMVGLDDPKGLEVLLG